MYAKQGNNTATELSAIHNVPTNQSTLLSGRVDPEIKEGVSGGLAWGQGRVHGGAKATAGELRGPGMRAKAAAGIVRGPGSRAKASALRGPGTRANSAAEELRGPGTRTGKKAATGQLRRTGRKMV